MSHVNVGQIEKFGSCVVVRMTNNSNVLTSQFIEGFHSALDTVERWGGIDVDLALNIIMAEYYCTLIAVIKMQSV